MTMQDPIADMFTRIRNAYARKKTVVSMPLSKMKTAISEVLLKEGFILGYKSTDEASQTSKLN